MSNRPKRQVASSQKVKAAAAGGGGTSPWVWVAVAGVVLVAAIAAVVISGGIGGDTTVTNSAGEEVEAIAFGEPSSTGTALPPLAELAADTAVGQPAPEITGQNFAGEPITVPAGPGSRIVMFLAHWCPHCQAEVPRLTEWLEANGQPEGVELYSVVTGTAEDRPNFPPGAWLQEEGWPVPVLVDDADGTAGNAYGLSGFPYFVVVGPDGEVVQRTSGELTVAQWEALIEAARTGTPSTEVGGPASPR